MARKFNWSILDEYQMRVQMPAYTDWWMRGDRYGTVVATGKRVGGSAPLYLIHLDKSGKCVIAKVDDCQEVYSQPLVD